MGYGYEMMRLSLLRDDDDIDEMFNIASGLLMKCEEMESTINHLETDNGNLTDEITDVTNERDELDGIIHCIRDELNAMVERLC